MWCFFKSFLCSISLVLWVFFLKLPDSVTTKRFCQLKFQIFRTTYSGCRVRSWSSTSGGKLLVMNWWVTVSGSRTPIMKRRNQNNHHGKINPCAACSTGWLSKCLISKRAELKDGTEALIKSNSDWVLPYQTALQKRSMP